MVYKCEYCQKTFAKNKSLFLAHKKTCFTPSPKVLKEQLQVEQEIRKEALQTFNRQVELYNTLWEPLNANSRGMQESTIPRIDYDPNAPKLQFLPGQCKMPVLMPRMRYPLINHQKRKNNPQLIYPDDMVNMLIQSPFKSKICNFIFQNRECGKDTLDELEIMDKYELIMANYNSSYIKRKTISQWSAHRLNHLKVYYGAHRYPGKIFQAASHVIFEQNLFSNFNWWILAHQYLRGIQCVNGATFFTQTEDQTAERRRNARKPSIPPAPQPQLYQYQIVPRVKRIMRNPAQIMDAIHQKKMTNLIKYPPALTDPKRYQQSDEQSIPDEWPESIQVVIKPKLQIENQLCEKCKARKQQYCWHLVQANSDLRPQCPHCVRANKVCACQISTDPCQRCISRNQPYCWHPKKQLPKPQKAQCPHCQRLNETCYCDFEDDEGPSRGKPSNQ